MDSKIVWSRSAAEEFDEILEYIAQDNPIAAADLANTVIESLERLSALPGMGTAAPSFGKNRRSILVTPNYRIVYRMKNHFIEISAIFHTRRDLYAAWRSKPRPG